MRRDFIYTVLFILAAGIAVADDQPLVRISFDNQAIENTGSVSLPGLSFYDQENDAPKYVDTGFYGIKAINFDGTNYVETGTNAKDLGISGAAPKTVSAIIKSDAYGNYCLWNVGNQADNQDFTIKVNGESLIMSQLWGGDFNTYSPVPTGQDWGLISQTYDGTTVRMYYNGALTGSKDVVLNTGETGNVRVGYWNALGNSYRGSIGQFEVYDTAVSSVQQYQNALDLGGAAYMFNELIDWSVINSSTRGWVPSNSDTMFISSNAYGVTGNGLFSYNPGNQYGVGSDDARGILWGQTFTVADDSKDISVKVGGSNFDITGLATEDGGTNLSKLRGVAGFVLYDVTQGKFLLDTYRCATVDGAQMEQKTIPLAGLKGHKIAMAIVDLATGGYGMTMVDDINIPLGTILTNDPKTQTVSALTYNFDTVGDWEDWYEVDANGNRLDSITNFQFNSPGTCNNYIGDSYITSNNGTGWDSATGRLRSEYFPITGDIIEFLINGGNGGNYGFELWVQQEGSEDYNLVETAQRSASDNSFEYNFWNVSEYQGLSAFLQLRDDQNQDWGWVGVDNIQMIEFNQVPEPATWALLVLGAAGLVLIRRKK